MAGNFKLTQAVFIERVKALHPTLDFTNTLYVNARTETTFICPEHGEQKIKAAKLLEGRGCPECGREKNRAFNAVRMAEVGKKTLSALSHEEKVARASRARAGLTAETRQKQSESQRQRLAAVPSEDRKARARNAVEATKKRWEDVPPEERKAKMAAVRAGKQHPNSNQ